MVTNLAERMAVFTEGQITWPEPELKLRCSDCARFSREGVKREGGGRCTLVEAHHRILGKIYTGADAIACPQFRKPELGK